MAKKFLAVALLRTPGENASAMSGENAFDSDHSIERSRYSVKPSAFRGRLRRKLLVFAVFIFPASIAFVIAGPLVGVLVAAWECAMALVVLMMMGARLCSIVKEDQ